MDIDVSLVRELVASQFADWAHLPIERVEPNGWDNRTFRLGSEMSVRLPSHQRYAAQVEKEQEWLPRLGPLLPLAVPTPLARGVPGHGYPWPWSVYGWLDGDTASVGPCIRSTPAAGLHPADTIFSAADHWRSGRLRRGMRLRC